MLHKRCKEFLGIPYRNKLDLAFIFLKALLAIGILYGYFFFGIVLLNGIAGWLAW